MKKLLIQIASSIFPNFVVNKAYQTLTNPQTKKLRVHEIEVLDKAEKEKVDFSGFKIQTYKWGNGSKKVLLIHGWEGQSGNFAEIIESLVNADYTVFAFDGPSHGYSSKGPTSLMEFTKLVAVMIRKFDVHKLVSHSFGCVATTYSLSINPDIRIEKYVLLTAPDKFSERIDFVAKQMGISENVKRKLIRRLKKETGLEVSQLNVSEFVKNINVEKALILQDKNDRIVTLPQSKAVHRNWKASTLEVLEGTGHFRILRDKKVVDRVVEFLG
jgi:pimeloyl-ACP methyl ester carboxylesterase